MGKTETLYRNWINYLIANPTILYYSFERPFESFISVLYETELENWTSFELVVSTPI